MKRAVLLSVILLSACASTPDPAVVCTAEWIEPRAERALERLESRTGRAFRALRKAGAAYVAGERPGPLTMLSVRRSLNSIEDELRDGPGVRDLRLLARTCDDPEFIRGQVAKLLDRQNVPTRIIAFLDATNVLDRLVELAEGPDTEAR